MCQDIRSCVVLLLLLLLQDAHTVSLQKSSLQAKAAR
jgi:hypothetical protein